MTLIRSVIVQLWKWFWRRWHWILLAFSTLFYCCAFVPPNVFWPAVFMAMLIPVALVLNTVTLFVFAILRKRKFLFPLLGLLFGSIFVAATFRWTKATPPHAGDIRILSFNAKLFRDVGTYSRFSPEMIEWVASDSSDIKCIQEYSTDSRWKELDITARIVARGYHIFSHQSSIEDNEHDLGMAIFSRYEIAGHGLVFEDTLSLNAAIYVDLLIGSDTLRIYNVHAGSMGLNLHEFRDFSAYPWKMKRLLSNLRIGAIKRTEQIGALLNHAQASPYPVIVCGDFNETPYSYNYRRLEASFGNTFGAVGSGFGFTLNSSLFFLRIDHQFSGAGLTPVSFSVDRSMKISDHFPTRGVYRLSTE